MKIYLKNTLSGLIPLYDSDFEQKRKLKLNTDYLADIVNPRNIGFHKKFFALINLGHKNTKLRLPFESYRAYVLMKAGYVKTFTTPSGLMFLPESISFANKTQDQFEEVYSRVIDVIIKDIGVTSEEIEKELIEFF